MDTLSTTLSIHSTKIERNKTGHCIAGGGSRSGMVTNVSQ